MADKKRKLSRLQVAARNKIKSFLTKHGIPKPKIEPKNDMTNSLRLDENNFQIPKIKNADLCNNNIKIQAKSFAASDDDYKLKSLNVPAKIINKKKQKKQKKQSKIVSSIETDVKLLPSSYDERLKKKYKILASKNNSSKLKNDTPPQEKTSLNTEPPKIKKNKTQNQQNTKLKYGATTQGKLVQKRQLITKPNKSNKKKKFNVFTVTDIASNNNFLYNSDSDSDADDYIETFFNDETDVDNSSNYTNGIQNSNGNEQLISINPNIPNDCSDDYEINDNDLVHCSNNIKTVSSDYNSSDKDSTTDDSTVISKDYSYDSYSSTDEDTHEDLCDLLYEDYSDDSKDTDYKLDESHADIYIKHGDAKIYDDAVENLEFDSDTTAIFEIPSKSNDIKTDSYERLSPICDRNKNFHSPETIQLPIIYKMKDDDEKKLPLKLELPNFAYSKKSKCRNITVNDITKNMQRNVSEIKKLYPKIDVPSPSSPTPSSITSPMSSFISPTVSQLSASSSSLSPSSSSPSSPSFSSTSTVSSSPLRSPQLASTNHTPEHTIDLLNIETNTEKLQSQSKSIFCNAINARQVLLLLKDKMYFHGSLKMKLLIGNIEIFGYKLNDESNDYVTVYSPRGQSFLYLTPIIQSSMNVDTTSVTTNKITNQLQLLKKEFLNYELEFILNEFNDETDAIILLERVENNPNINMIEKYMKQNVFPNINAFNCQRKCYSSEFILHSKFFINPIKGLKINALEWNDLQISNNSKIFICGGKGVGKSTLLRYLVNSNLSKLSKFLIIDLDIGQSELFLPQTISATLLNEPILGPGYLKNISPEYSILFGNINVLISPLKYLKCVIELITFCNDNMEYKNIPWIINTMGYVRGIGTELIVSLIKIINPTNVIQLKGEHIVNDNFDILLHSNDINSYQFKLCENEMKLFNGNHNNKNITVDYKLHLWNALKLEQRFTEWDITQRDLRYIMILSKLGNMFTGTDEWITDVKPFCTSLDEITVMIFNEDDGTISNLSTELIPDIINCNLVYLCQSTPALYKEDNFIKCYGIGIVRIADRTSNTIYLLSSIPPNTLRHVNALAICNIPLLPSLLVNQSKNVEGTMPYLYKTDKFVGSKQIVQMSTYRSK